jgi:hypothetical protein
MVRILTLNPKDREGEECEICYVRLRNKIVWRMGYQKCSCEKTMFIFIKEVT